MSDRRLRELERKAVQGDGDAKRELIALWGSLGLCVWCGLEDDQHYRPGLCWVQMVENKSLPWPRQPKESWRDVVGCYVREVLSRAPAGSTEKEKRKLLLAHRPWLCRYPKGGSSHQTQVWRSECNRILAGRAPGPRRHPQPDDPRQTKMFA